MPQKKPSKSKLVWVKLSQDCLDNLDNYAKVSQLSRATLMRIVLTSFANPNVKQIIDLEELQKQTKNLSPK